MAILGLMPAVLATPLAQAAPPNGVYKVTRVSGSVTVNNRVVEIPQGILQDAFAQNGRITIRDNRIPLYRARWANVLEQFNDLGLNGTLTTSGPSSVLLKPTANGFAGRTPKPVRLELEGDFIFTEVSLNMAMNFRAKVTGNTLTITSPISIMSTGLLEGKGQVTLVAKK